MSKIDDLCSEFPYRREPIEKLVRKCGGDLDAARWLLRLFASCGGGVPMSIKDWEMLVEVAKKATEAERAK